MKIIVEHSRKLFDKNFTTNKFDMCLNFSYKLKKTSAFILIKSVNSIRLYYQLTFFETSSNLFKNSLEILKITLQNCKTCQNTPIKSVHWKWKRNLNAKIIHVKLYLIKNNERHTTTKGKYYFSNHNAFKLKFKKVEVKSVVIYVI